MPGGRGLPSVRGGAWRPEPPLEGALSMATIVDWLTWAQLRRQLGALPVLYRLLEILDVRRIINRHCPMLRRSILAQWSWFWSSTG